LAALTAKPSAIGFALRVEGDGQEQFLPHKIVENKDVLSIIVIFSFVGRHHMFARRYRDGSRKELSIDWNSKRREEFAEATHAFKHHPRGDLTGHTHAIADLPQHNVHGDRFMKLRAGCGQFKFGWRLGEWKLNPLRRDLGNNLMHTYSPDAETPGMSVTDRFIAGIDLSLFSERHERDGACPLDRDRQLPLMSHAISWDAPRDDTASFGQKITKQTYIFIINRNSVVAKPTYPPALK
jgi:hypothetical protein